VVVGFASGEIPRIPLNLVLLKGAVIVGCELASLYAHHPLAAQHRDEVIARFVAGEFSPWIGASFDLEHTGDALRELAERRAIGFSYLHGNDLIGLSTSLDSDGFVTSLSNPFPELMVAQWDAARSGNAAESFQLMVKAARLGRIVGYGPNLACLEAACKHRRLFDRMLPEPLRSLDASADRRVAEVLDAEGIRPIRDRA